MRPGKGKISRRGYFYLLTSSFYQYNWLSSPSSLVSQVTIARRWELWDWGCSQAWIFSFNPPNGWMDNLRFYGVFFVFFNIISYQDDGNKIFIKLCAM